MRMLQFPLLVSLLFTYSVSAHDGDHGAPGALPFAPHGGKAVEAAEDDQGDEEDCELDHEDAEHEEDSHDEKTSDSHDHEGENHEEIEYFFEATYSNGKVTVYPLALREDNPKEFILVSVNGELKDLRVTVEFPRSKRTEAVAMEFVRDEARGDHWKGQVPQNKDIRFYANISVNWKGVERKARIHLEKRK